MKRYLTVSLGIITFFLVIFLLDEAIGVPLLSDPLSWLKQGGAPAALIGVTLLVSDIVLPVPSSLVMIAHGAIFGVFIGSILSLVGSTGAALTGFAIGRRGGVLLKRSVSPKEHARAEQLVRSWGAPAIVITRPIPLLAETVAILAGTTSLGWGRAALAALLGSLPGAVLYALTGAVATDFQSSLLMFGFVLLIAGFFWIIGYWIESRAKRGQITSLD
jgi:uncharacterized membrane protein YdjX (TVP38/TMEM64 family)